MNHVRKVFSKKITSLVFCLACLVSAPAQAGFMDDLRDFINGTSGPNGLPTGGEPRNPN